jgi:single-strand DNA-binding protein
MFSAYFLAMTGGLAITSFRLASSQRRFDRGQQKWIDADTNWYTVSAFRGLASNAAVSIVKGDRVVVTGRLRIRDWENTDRSGTTVEIEADTIGHDMFWGTSQFQRVSAASGAEQDPGDSQDAWPNAS